MKVTIDDKEYNITGVLTDTDILLKPEWRCRCPHIVIPETMYQRLLNHIMDSKCKCSCKEDKCCDQCELDTPPT